MYLDRSQEARDRRQLTAELMAARFTLEELKDRYKSARDMEDRDEAQIFRLAIQRYKLTGGTK